MNKSQPDLGWNGQNALFEPPVARALLAWLGGLAGCASLGELARRARLSSRTLARFAAGTAGRGGPKTLASLLDVVQIPLWAAMGVMLPTLRTINDFWRRGQADRRGLEEDLQAYRSALELAASTSWLELLARQDDRGAGDLGGTARPGLHPADARVLIGWLQALGDWPRRDLARKTGVSHEALRMYEEGTWPLERPVAQSLATGAGVPAWLLEGLMLPTLRAVRRLAAHPRRVELSTDWQTFPAALMFPASAPLGTPASRRHSKKNGPKARPWGPWPADLVKDSVSRRDAGGPRGAQDPTVCAVRCRPDPAAADREVAEELWLRLQGRGAAERILLVKRLPEYHSWAVVERLCTASREAATDSAKKALQLALLALRAARSLRVEAHFALQLEGFSFVHVANAWRVLGRLQRADKAYGRGVLFWRAGEATRFPFLPAWRVLDLGGSLRRDQRRFGEAIDFLEHAREAAPREVWGRILLKKATVFDQQGEPAAAMLVLEEAATCSDVTHYPSLQYRWRCMMGSQLCHLGRYHQAADLMPGTMALAAAHGQALENLRLDWLRGRIAVGLGDPKAALAAFNAVRKEFHRLRMAYDYALASLAAAEVLLQDGRHEEVEVLALELESIFRQEGGSEEAAKALHLFRQAVEARTATPELAGKVVRFLYKAQHNPELRFAA
jgi:transcriptional regulator with XRE-family HTH domain